MSAHTALVAALRSAGCVFAEDEAALLVHEAPDEETLTAWTRRRVAGEPLETILGWAEFAGSRIAVLPGVFVPRRRSVVLVDAVADVAPPRATVAELCCGTAAVSVALLHRRPDLDVHASDIDPLAVTLARRNLGARARASTGDLYAALPARLRGRLDVIVANAPYVPTEAIASMPREAVEHEPRAALDGGHDGLELHRRIAAGAGEWLRPGGALVLETSTSQVAGDVRILAGEGLRAEVRRAPEVGGTAVVGRSAPPPARPGEPRGRTHRRPVTGSAAVELDETAAEESL